MTARQATFEAVVQPAASFVSEWVPNDSNGELFKIERAFEFNDSRRLDGRSGAATANLHHHRRG